MSDGDAQFLDIMKALVEAPKAGARPTQWTQQKGSDQVNAVLPLTLLGGAQPVQATARVALRARARRRDRDVSFTLVATIRGRDMRCWRFDWRPAAPHINREGPPSLRGLSVETGIHTFDENAALGLREMQLRNLPICTPFSPEPADFKAVVTAICDSLRIELTEPIPEPPWSELLPL